MASSQTKDQRLPRNTSLVGMLLFLAALTVLFAGSLLVYTLIRTGVFGAKAAPLHTVQLPSALWISTGLMLAASFTLHLALASVRRERQRELRIYLLNTLILAVAFVLVQAPSMLILLSRHGQAIPQGMAAYGAIFFLVLVHALHVIGGLVPLAIVSRNAFAGRYDHESHEPVRNILLYWHFLDGVWLVMFALLWLLG